MELSRGKLLNKHVKIICGSFHYWDHGGIHCYVVGSNSKSKSWQHAFEWCLFLGPLSSISQLSEAKIVSLLYISHWYLCHETDLKLMLSASHEQKHLKLWAKIASFFKIVVTVTKVIDTNISLFHLKALSLSNIGKHNTLRVRISNISASLCMFTVS